MIKSVYNRESYSNIKLIQIEQNIGLKVFSYYPSVKTNAFKGTARKQKAIFMFRVLPTPGVFLDDLKLSKQ